MSLAHCNWRYVGSQVFGSATVASALDAFYTLGTATAYADGTTRTPGSGSAGTWSRYQNSGTTQALYLTPAEGALNHRIILAGAASTPSPAPTMAAPDAYNNDCLMANLVKNAGAFNAWNASSPFTSGSTFGYWRFWNAAAGAGTVYLWESKDAIAAFVTNSAGDKMWGCFVGALIDPETADTSTDAESDGKLYGMITSHPGSNSGIESTFLSSSSSSATGFLPHYSFNEGNHAAVFTPGAGTLINIHPVTILSESPSPTSLKTRSGLYGRMGITMRSSTNLLGRLREMYYFSDAIIGTKLTSGGSTVGYLVGSRADSAADALFLEH